MMVPASNVSFQSIFPLDRMMDPERLTPMRKYLLGSVLWVMSTVLGLLSDGLEAYPWHSEKGLASHYGNEFQGKKTASGERFSQSEMTAAHRKLPLGTKVMVENMETGEKTEVKITDRGPYADSKRRIIDLSRGAADSIGIAGQGVGPVRVTVTERPADAQKTSPNEDTFFEVQVGAFADGQQAQQVFSQLQPWFQEVYIASRDGPAGAYYRVRIGPFRTKAPAQQVASALKRGGHHVFLDEVPESALPKEAPLLHDQRP
jgi:rare lipoprotein A